MSNALREVISVRWKINLFQEIKKVTQFYIILIHNIHHSCISYMRFSCLEK